MNWTDRHNYISAAVASLVIHFLLLSVALPGFLTPDPAELETVPMELVEIPVTPRQGRIAFSQRPAHGAASQSSGNAQANSRPPELNTAPNSVRTPQNASLPPKPAAPAPHGERRENQGGQSAANEKADPKSAGQPNAMPQSPAAVPGKATSENSAGPMADPSGPGETDADFPDDLGTGEELVTAFGPMPTYPPQALKEGKKGRVTVRALINAKGILNLAIITKTSGDIRLDHAATASLKQKWQFKPLAKGYYIDLTFFFNAQIGVSVRFGGAKIRP